MQQQAAVEKFKVRGPRVLELKCEEGLWGVRGLLTLGKVGKEGLPGPEGPGTPSCRA